MEEVNPMWWQVSPESRRQTSLGEAMPPGIGRYLVIDEYNLAGWPG